MTIGLATAIVAAMLHWGSGSPQRATEITRTVLDPGPDTALSGDKPNRPKTAAEIAAILAEFKAAPPLAALSAVDTAPPAEGIEPVETTGIEIAETVPVIVEPVEPDPVFLDVDDPDLEAEFVAARVTKPDVTFAVARSRLPVARPATLRRTVPASDPVPDRALAVAPPASNPHNVDITPTAVSLAVAEAMQEVTPEPVSLALEEAMSDDLLYVSGTRVNLRERPSIGAAVVTHLAKGDAAHVLADAGDGWLHVRDVSSGDEGFMAEIFLSDASPR